MINKWLEEEKRVETSYSKFAVIDLTENENRIFSQITFYNFLYIGNDI